jgi:transposase
MWDVTIIGIDLGKNSCSLVGLDAAGAVVLRRRVRRDGLVSLLAKLPASIVAMEACCGAHHLGRLLAAQGCEVRLMSPEYVRPYVKAQKNDDRDAEAIAEAAIRPTMRFVALTTEAQLDVQVLHRVRDRLVGQRTSLMKQMRSILLERGIVAPQGRRSLLDALAAVSAQGDASGLGRRIRLLHEDMLDQWRALDARIKALDDEFAEMARSDPAARRLATIPGVGVMNPRRSSRRSVTGAASAEVATSPHGWPWCRAKQRQAQAVWYYQARQQIPSQAHHPRRTRGAALAGENGDAARFLAARPTCAGSWKHSSSCPNPNRP